MHGAERVANRRRSGAGASGLAVGVCYPPCFCERKVIKKNPTSMKAIAKRYSQVVPPDSRVYVTVCAGCGKDVFGWTQQLANEAWKNHECETPKRKTKSK